MCPIHCETHERNLFNLTEEMFTKGLIVLFLLSFESKKSAMVYEHNNGERLTSVFGSRLVSYIHDGFLPGTHEQAFKTLST